MRRAVQAVQLDGAAAAAWPHSLLPRPTVATAMPGILHKKNLDFRMPPVSRLRL